MSTVEIPRRLAEGSPRLRDKFVVAYYLLSVLMGTFFFFFHGRLALAEELVAAVIYLSATALLCGLSFGNGDRAKTQTRDSGTTRESVTNKARQA